MHSKLKMRTKNLILKSNILQRKNLQRKKLCMLKYSHIAYVMIEDYFNLFYALNACLAFKDIKLWSIDQKIENIIWLFLLVIERFNSLLELWT